MMFKACFRLLIKPYLKIIKTEISQGAGGFLPPATHTTETTTHFYFGWSATGLMQRQNRSDASAQYFQSVSFSTDWTNRVNLKYR